VVTNVSTAAKNKKAIISLNRINRLALQSVYSPEGSRRLRLPDFKTIGT